MDDDVVVAVLEVPDGDILDGEVSPLDHADRWRQVADIQARELISPVGGPTLAQVVDEVPPDEALGTGDEDPHGFAARYSLK